jgi:hypothetical protein
MNPLHNSAKGTLSLTMAIVRLPPLSLRAAACLSLAKRGAIQLWPALVEIAAHHAQAVRQPVPYFLRFRSVFARKLTHKSVI